VFADASAVTAIITNEAEQSEFAAKLTSSRALTSGIAIWESSLAVSRIFEWPVARALSEVRDYLFNVDVTVVSIGDGEAAVALEAHQRFGKGRHPAKLNMGDCFSYACARVHGVPLLFKGDDFVLTDIERA
jgi:ribonuclease VapC